jgi:hypothetical protein
VNRIVLREGARSGAILASCAVVFAVLGLTPALSWIPEVPLLAAAVVIPVAILGWTGVAIQANS